MEKSIRKVDELGRIVLPIEMRRTLDLTENAEVEMWLESEKHQIVIQKAKPSCMCCGGEEELKQHRNKWICSACQNEIAKL